MKQLLPIAAFLVAVTISNTSKSASFNCRYAKLSAEVAICQSDNLNVLDEKMARKYFHLKNRTPGHIWAQIRNQQKRWIRRRNRCGYDNYCLEDSYVYRIRSLNHWLSEY